MHSVTRLTRATSSPFCPPLWPNNTQTHWWNPLTPYLVYSTLTSNKDACFSFSSLPTCLVEPAPLAILLGGPSWCMVTLFSRIFEYSKLCSPAFLLCPLLWLHLNDHHLKEHRTLSQVKFTVCYYSIEPSLLFHIRIDSFLSTSIPFTLGPKPLMLRMLESPLQEADAIACFPHLKSCLCVTLFLVLKIKKAMRHGPLLRKADSLEGRQACTELIIMQ